MAIKQTHQTSVLVVALPGMMETLLKRTLANRVDVNVVGTASGGLSAVGIIQEKLPDLVVIESNLPEFEMTKLVEWIKSEHQEAYVLVLAESSEQLNQAQKTGADDVLWSYSFQEKLDQVIEKMKLNRGFSKVDEGKGVKNAG